MIVFYPQAYAANTQNDPRHSALVGSNHLRKRLAPLRDFIKNQSRVSSSLGWVLKWRPSSRKSLRASQSRKDF